MDKSRPSTGPLIIAIVLLILPLLYVASYLALVRPNRTGPVTIAPNDWYVVGSRYAISGTVPEILFWPLERIDRKLRPQAWGEKLELE